VLSGDSGAPLTGRITPELVARLVPEVRDVFAWFLCGPQAMVDDVKTSLTAVTEPARVLTEVFHVDNGPAASRVSIDVRSEVTIALGGDETTIEVMSSGEPILDAALQAGMDPPYSCAGGACGTCRAKVSLGRAVMDQNHVLTDAMVDDGYILTCQAHPVTEELHLDYDA
jgi:ring-1,2-phenylacetyl-CoA epoxidase subunit PaaE